MILSHEPILSGFALKIAANKKLPQVSLGESAFIYC